jgi:chromosome segregation ATPase
MDISIENLLSVAGLFIGGGGIGGILTWRYSRRRDKAEAESAEANAAKELQDIYQQLINDVKADRDEQKAYISELKEDRRHLRAERDELSQRLDKTDETVRTLQREVARNGRMVEAMRPFLCSRLGCKQRQRMVVNDDGTMKSTE